MAHPKTISDDAQALWNMQLAVHAWLQTAWSSYRPKAIKIYCDGPKRSIILPVLPEERLQRLLQGDFDSIDWASAPPPRATRRQRAERITSLAGKAACPGN